MTSIIPSDYLQGLMSLKTEIRQARLKASLSVNRELIILYWKIGNDILTRQDQAGWGAKVIEQLAKDLRAEFPDMTGFSSRNLKYMRAFAEAWADNQLCNRLLHNCRGVIIS